MNILLKSCTCCLSCREIQRGKPFLKIYSSSMVEIIAPTFYYNLG